MSTKTTGRIQREAHLRWVSLDRTRVSQHAQREFNQAWGNKLLADMDIEQIGYPVVNYRDGWFWIIDGQHRIWALKKYLGGEESSQFIQCYVYEGENALTERLEADTFVKQNSRRTVPVFELFRVGVNAGYTEETDIDRIVRHVGLHVSRDRGDGAIRAVTALRKTYRLGAGVLARTLRIIRDAYGDAGLEAPYIEGIGLMCHRFNGRIEDDALIVKLSQARGGCSGLMNEARALRLRTGKPLAHCVAAAAIDFYNAGRRGHGALTSWWKFDEQ